MPTPSARNGPRPDSERVCWQSPSPTVFRDLPLGLRSSVRLRPTSAIRPGLAPNRSINRSITAPMGLSASALAIKIRRAPGLHPRAGEQNSVGRPAVLAALCATACCFARAGSQPGFKLEALVLLTSNPTGLGRWPMPGTRQSHRPQVADGAAAVFRLPNSCLGRLLDLLSGAPTPCVVVFNI